MAATSPLDQERDHDERGSDDRNGGRGEHCHIASRGHKASGEDARGRAGGRVDERRLQAARRPVRAVGAQGRLGRDGELGLGGGHLVDVQALGLDRHRARTLKGGVALGRLELADLQLARVHARDVHAAVLARGDGGLALRIPRAVGR